MAKRRKNRRKKSKVNTARRRARDHQQGFGLTSLNLPEGVSLFSLKSDKPVRLDILPYKVGKNNPWADEGELHYERTYWVHRGIGAENNSYICLRKTLDERCPVCEFRAKLSNNPDADEDLIKSLGPSERQLFNVIDLRDRDKGVQIWDMAWWLFGKALDARIRNEDDDDNYGDFYQLEDGCTLKLGIEENHFAGRAFYSVDSIDFKNRKEEYDEDILDEVHNLDEVVKITPYDELKKILLQTEEEDEKPKSKKSKSKKKQQDEEEDEDFDDLDEEEEEDEDFDDNDLDEEEEEEDEDFDDLDKEEEEEDEDFDEDFGNFDEEDEDFDDLDDDDFDEEEEQPKKKKSSKKKSSKKKSSKKKSSKKKSSKKKSKKKGRKR